MMTQGTQKWDAKKVWIPQEALTAWGRGTGEIEKELSRSGDKGT